MYKQLPVFQNVGSSAYKPGFDRINKLLTLLKSPQKEFKSIHVAGTNGKGSTAHLISSILQESGYNVGLFTSPHLIDFRERIKINSKFISKDEVKMFIMKNIDFLIDNKITFFEMTVAMAFNYFSKNKVDIALIEVGLGGRLDATNIIKPNLSIITNISLEHTEFLGETIEEIAREKAGIIKIKTPVVIGERNKKTEECFKKIALKRESKIIFASDYNYDFDYLIDVSYQKKNVKTALASLQFLSFLNIKKEDIKNGLKKFKTNTSFIGRWQVLKKNPKIILDVSHNFEGFKNIIEQIKNENFERLIFVMGFVKGKNIKQIFSVLPKRAFYFISQPNIDRAYSIEEIKIKLESFSHNIIYSNSLKESYYKALEISLKEDLIVLTGSNFIAQELMDLI
jgi:dihydrofolate synthase/folylpolyglutamate synthase